MSRYNMDWMLEVPFGHSCFCILAWHGSYRTAIRGDSDWHQIEQLMIAGPVFRGRHRQDAIVGQCCMISPWGPTKSGWKFEEFFEF